jgi:hypothetical protein
MYVYALCVWGGGVWRPEKVADPLELELQAAMSCHMGLGIEPWSSGRAINTLNC